MTHSITFTVPGRLKGKGRARSAFIKPKGGGPGFITNYTPADTRNAEAMVRSLGAKAMGGAPPMDGPIRLALHIWMNPPPSWSKKRRAETLYVTGKPDVDNVVKLFDALNGIAWRDDSQIAMLHVIRCYRTDGGEETRVEIDALRAVDLLERVP